MTIAHCGPRCFDHLQVAFIFQCPHPLSPLVFFQQHQKVCGERLFLSTAPLDRDTIDTQRARALEHEEKPPLN